MLRSFFARVTDSGNGSPSVSSRVAQPSPSRAAISTACRQSSRTMRKGKSPFSSFASGKYSVCRQTIAGAASFVGAVEVAGCSSAADTLDMSKLPINATRASQVLARPMERRTVGFRSMRHLVSREEPRKWSQSPRGLSIDDLTESQRVPATATDDGVTLPCALAASRVTITFLNAGVRLSESTDRLMSTLHSG